MPSPFEELKSFQFSTPENSSFPKRERLSQKPLDIAIREIVESNPDLRRKILDSMRLLVSSSERLPLVHVTADRIELPDGSVSSSGMTENIEERGFKNRHTNVGAFVVREDSTRIAQPQDYENNPDDFLKSLAVLLKRYWHHGVRTNKDIYQERRDRGKGRPIMFLLNGDLLLEAGTDYDDHFILKEDASPGVIWGKVNLETETGIDGSLISRVANDILEIILSRARKDHETA